MRFLALAILLFAAACGPMVSSNPSGATRGPSLSTADIAPMYGCTHIAQLINDPSIPLEHVLRRRGACPPMNTPGWIVVHDAQSYSNYEGIGRGVRAGVAPVQVSSAASDAGT